MKLLHIRPLSPEWHERRNDPTVITASEVPSILGIEGAFESPLEVWARKLGKAEPSDLSASEPVVWGNRTENLNRQWCAEEIGHPILPSPGLCQHEELDWLLATPDGCYPRDLSPIDDPDELLELSYGDCDALWEGKSPSWAALDWRDDVPQKVWVQLQAQLEVCDFGEGTVSALIAPSIRWRTLERDEQWCQAMIEQLEEFREHIRQDRQPPADGRDLELIQKLLPAPTRLAVAQAPELEGDAEEYAVLGEEIKGLEARRRACKARLVGAMGDAEFLQAGDFIYKRSRNEIPEGTRRAYTREDFRAVKAIR